MAFWSVNTGKKLQVFSDQTSVVVTVAFIKQSKDQFMLSSTRDGALCIREFLSAKVVVSTQGHTNQLVSTAIAPNSLFMVSGSQSGLGYITSLPHGALTATLAGHTAAINCVRVFLDSTRCVTGSSNATIRVWSIDRALCTATLHLDRPVLACDISHSNIILYGTEGGWVSTAAYQPDPTKPNALISWLNAGGSPIMSSSTTSTVSSHENVADTPGSDMSSSKSANQPSFQRDHPSPIVEEDEVATAEGTDFGAAEVSLTPPTQQPSQQLNEGTAGVEGQGTAGGGGRDGSNSSDHSQTASISASNKSMAHQNPQLVLFFRSTRLLRFYLY